MIWRVIWMLRLRSTTKIGQAFSLLNCLHFDALMLKLKNRFEIFSYAALALFKFSDECKCFPHLRTVWAWTVQNDNEKYNTFSCLNLIYLFCMYNHELRAECSFGLQPTANITKTPIKPIDRIFAFLPPFWCLNYARLLHFFKKNVYDFEKNLLWYIKFVWRCCGPHGARIHRHFGDVTVPVFCCWLHSEEAFYFCIVFYCQRCKAQRPREILPPIRTFCFDHFTVKN